MPAMTNAPLPDHPLVRFRETEGISQTDLARRVGVGRATINRIETGVRQASPKLALRIEAATGVPRAEIRPDIFGDVLAGAAP